MSPQFSTEEGRRVVTECIEPGAVTDDDLVAYAAGERPRRVRAHVQACAACAAAVARCVAIEDQLGQALFRFDCPTGLELGEYHLDLLAEGARRRVAAHLTRCPHCMAELATAQGFFDRAASAAPAEPPGRRARQAARAALERVVAQLIPLPMATAAGLRGTGTAVTWRYEAGDLTLTLHPQPADRPRGQHQVLAFVERRDADLDSLSDVPVRLVDAAGVTVAATTIDMIGNFIIGPAPAGAYMLELTLPERIVVVPDLALGTT